MICSCLSWALCLLFSSETKDRFCWNFVDCFDSKFSSIISHLHFVWTSLQGFSGIDKLIFSISGTLDYINVSSCSLHYNFLRWYIPCFEINTHFSQMMKVNCDMAQEYYLQQTIKDKLQGYSFQHPKCSASVILMLAVELQQIKEDIAAIGAGRTQKNGWNFGINLSCIIISSLKKWVVYIGITLLVRPSFQVSSLLSWLLVNGLI